MKSRIANIEKNLKPGISLPVPVPMSNSNAIKTTIKKTGNDNVNQNSKPLRREKSVPRELLEIEDEEFRERAKSSSIAPVSKGTSSFPAIRSAYASYFEPEATEHVLRPSLAKSIPTYKAVTESHLKSSSKLTIKLVGSSVVRSGKTSS